MELFKFSGVSSGDRGGYCMISVFSVEDYTAGDPCIPNLGSILNREAGKEPPSEQWDYARSW